MTDLLGSTSLASISSFQRPFGPRIHMDEAAVSAVPTVVHEAPTGSATMSASEAGRALADSRRKKREAAPVVTETAATTETESAADGADQATAAFELSDEGSADPVETQNPGETVTEQNPSAETPKPLPLPRSWTKEQAEQWSALPRETQEYLTKRDSDATAELRRIQREAAENSKTLTVKEKAAEEQRNQYEGKLKSVVEIMEREQLRDFPNIRSQADLDKMVGDAVSLSAKAAGLWSTDPLQAGQVQAQVQQIQSTLAAWDVHQRKLVGVSNELKASEDRKKTEKSDSWNKHVQEQNKLAAEKIPELADTKKAPALIKAATESLLALGFTQEELTKLSTGEERISLADHRLQLLVRSHLRLAEIHAAPKAVAAKTLPAVQKPGTPAPRSTAQSETIKALTSKLNTSGNLKDAVALRQAQQRAQRRA